MPCNTKYLMLDLTNLGVTAAFVRFYKNKLTSYEKREQDLRDALAARGMAMYPTNVHCGSFVIARFSDIATHSHPACAVVRTYRLGIDTDMAVKADAMTADAEAGVVMYFFEEGSYDVERHRDAAIVRALDQG